MTNQFFSSIPFSSSNLSLVSAGEFAFCVRSLEIQESNLVLSSRSTRSLRFLVRFLISEGFATLIDLFAADYPSRTDRFEVVYRFSKHLSPRKGLPRFSYTLAYFSRVYAQSFQTSFFKSEVSLFFTLPQFVDRWSLSFFSTSLYGSNPIDAPFVPFGANVTVRLSVPPSFSVPSLSSILKSASWMEREVWDMFGIVFHGNTDLRRILTDYGFESFPLRKDFPLTGYLELRYDHDGRKVVSQPVDFSFAQEYRNYEFFTPWRATTIE